MSQDSANKLAFSVIKTNIQSNFATNMAVQSAMLEESGNIDQFMMKLEKSLHISKASRAASQILKLNSIRGRGQFRGRNNRGDYNYRGRCSYNGYYDSNKNTSNNNITKTNYRNYNYRSNNHTDVQRLLI
jgi:hypothetical protein